SRLAYLAATGNRARKKAPAGSAGAFCLIRIVTNFSWPAVAGRPGYQDGRRPVAPVQQAPGGRGHPDPAVRDAAHTPIPDRYPSAGRRNAAACARAVAAAVT